MFLILLLTSSYVNEFQQWQTLKQCISDSVQGTAAVEIGDRSYSETLNNFQPAICLFISICCPTAEVV